MRKTMKLGAASTLAAVALVAGSATAATAFGGGHPDDPYICGNSVAETEADGDGASAESTGNGPVPNCQVGYTNIYNNNATSDDNEGGDQSLIGDISGTVNDIIPN
ncbi:hypothetical protein [Streptomyces neyagawaensis]|uniref:hypothetical protein n=1 Tax=Streptomyces neyagawaensis TaxID=42238 RepID=UPI0006E218CE|nr:hypothetical protein [Streptomyces neyagawaensis]MCL6733245.1 hypothetical protein [Streptomyces neyagawaensis]MDE1685047.1 hypothetical protein [Streptomyces neyagawaensis]